MTRYVCRKCEKIAYVITPLRGEPENFRDCIYCRCPGGMRIKESG